jgi:hypothetical protein
MKLLRPTQEQMNDISMPESFRSFVIEQQGIQGNQDAIQRAALQEQNALAAEQAAQEYFNQPATARERFLADNPQAYASSAGSGIYREQMMQMRQPSLADRTLAPTLSRKLPVTARGDFQRLIDEGTPVLEAYDRAEVMEYNRGQRAKLAEFYSPEEVKAKFGSDESPIGDDAVQYAIRERKAGGGSTLGSLKAYADFATERLKRFTPEGFAPDPTDEVNYPLYEAALKDVEEAEAAYLNALRGAGGIRRPKAVQTDLTPPGGAVPKGAELQGLEAAPATSFRDTMKQFAGGTAEVLPKLTEKEEVELVSSISDSPDALIDVVRSDQRSLKAKEEALRKLQEFEKKLPTFTFTEGTPQQIAEIRQNLPQLIAEAKKEISLIPAKRMVDKAWETEKNNISSQIEDFAKALGVSPKLAEKWIAENVEYTTAFDPTSDAMPRAVGTREYFNEFLENRAGKRLSDEADILKRFTGVPGGVDAGLWRYIIGKGKTYEDVLDAYLSSKKASVAEADGTGTVAPTPTPPVEELNIKKVTIKKP